MNSNNLTNQNLQAQNLQAQQYNSQFQNPLCFNTDTQRVCLSVVSLQNIGAVNGQDINGPISTQGVLGRVARFLGLSSSAPAPDPNDLF